MCTQRQQSQCPATCKQNTYTARPTRVRSKNIRGKVLQPDIRKISKHNLHCYVHAPNNHEHRLADDQRSTANKQTISSFVYILEESSRANILQIRKKKFQSNKIRRPHITMTFARGRQAFEPNTDTRVRKNRNILENKYHNKNQLRRE